MDTRAEAGMDAAKDNEALARELAALRDEVSDLADQVRGFVEDSEHDLVRNAMRIGQRARGVAERDAAYVLDEIENNPVIAASIALAAGTLAGIFFATRSR